jgi:hypothetical protein
MTSYTAPTRRTLEDSRLVQRQETFSKNLGIYSHAIDMLAKRQFFYEALLKGEGTLSQKYDKIIGENDREERIVCALENSRRKGEKLIEKIASLFGKITDYNADWKALYMREQSPCEITEVCVCEFGRREPYIGSCNGDKTTIAEDTFLREERRQQGSHHLMNQIFQNQSFKKELN